MKNKNIFIKKASGAQDVFSADKLRESLKKSGADNAEVDNIVAEIKTRLYDGISTKKIYEAAYSLLKKGSRSNAGRYDLKRAIMALGPSGFPFEKYIAAIFEWQGYTVQTQLFLQGACVTHEIDVLAENSDHFLLVECKYHNSTGIVSNVKIPLYINSRYKDVASKWSKTSLKPLKCCVATNTKFSSDAIKYGVCVGMQMLGWDYPHNKSLSNLIDKSGLYPITCLTTLTKNEKDSILAQGFILCKELLHNESLFHNLGISHIRISNILLEIKSLCNIKNEKMKKILATTDFSDNSKAGLYFAIQLASQNNFEITFFHTYHVIIPSSWNAVRMEGYEKDEAVIIQERLNTFIRNIYKDLNITDANYKCIIQSSVFIDTTIREYAEENNIGFICISTKGAGNFERLLGTNTANLINNSAVPVIAVPHQYITTTITKILYVSDLINYEKEIAKVIEFAAPLKASVELLHLTTALDKKVDLDVIEKAIKSIRTYNVDFKTTPRNPNNSLVSDIEVAVKEVAPSVMVMFTEQNRGWFEKIFLSSKSAEYSFNAKVPLLVFHKA